MKMIVHPGLNQAADVFWDLERTLRMRKAPDTLQRSLLGLRSKFRRAVRDCADNSRNFSSSGNGDGSFSEFIHGFEFAASLGKDIDVFYFRFYGATETSFFYKLETMNHLNKVIDSFQPKIDEFKDLIKTYNIILA